MDTNIRQVFGNWDRGYVLDKHVLRSVFTGYSEFGHAQFDTTRSEVGEALFKLKYRREWAETERLAREVVASLVPRFGKIDLIVPMPASNARPWQPVSEVAKAVSAAIGVPVFEDIIIKVPEAGAEKQLKNMTTREEKVAALRDRFVLRDAIKNEGRWNALVLDDLFDTGASMEAACATLRTYRKIADIYVAALTWK